MSNIIGNKPVDELIAEFENYRNDNSLFPRMLAAEILFHVAMDGSFGGFPKGITAEMIGRAIGRIVSNSDEPNKMSSLLCAIGTSLEN